MSDIDGNTPVLDDAKMRELGFTDHVPERWYFCRKVGRFETLNISINKGNGDYSETVMDEFSGQPARYGRMLPHWRWIYRDAIDAILTELNAAGLEVAVDHTLYGFAVGEVSPNA